MDKLRLLILGLLVLATGLSAGQLYHEQVGDQEALLSLPARTYVEYWQALDKLMAVRMPLVGQSLLALFVVALMLMYRQWKSLPFRLLLAALLLNVAGVVVTVTQQVPVNQQIQALRLDDLPADVTPYKTATARHFRWRALLGIASFALTIGASLLVSRGHVASSSAVPAPGG